MTQPTATRVRDGETIDDLDDTLPQATSLALRSPSVAVTLEDITALPNPNDVAIARAQVIATLRTAAIRATYPEDYVLFKAPDEHGGQIVGYLQDAGCDRVRDIFGIEIFDITKPERIAAVDGTFHYLITGAGRCRLTRQIVESMEGGRSSTDDFCKGKSGVDLELTVRKAARANLDGNITRELAGMKAIPLDELVRAWEGQNKRVEQCRRGRGFGTHDERLGGRSEKAPDVDPPTCAVCGKTGVYRTGRNGRGAFYGCPDYTKHQDKKWTVDAEQWVAQAKQKATGADTPAAAAPAPATTAPPTAGEIFGTRGEKR
jgi:hypothetical protein